MIILDGYGGELEYGISLKNCEVLLVHFERG